MGAAGQSRFLLLEGTAVGHFYIRKNQPGR
jgi:hypothetical protein